MGATHSESFSSLHYHYSRSAVFTLWTTNVEGADDFYAVITESLEHTTLNSYKLKDKDQDQNFLAGNFVKGSAVFLKTEFKDGIIKNDERIVIILSNGKKYMGKVVSFNYIAKGEVIEGQLEITKA